MIKKILALLLVLLLSVALFACNETEEDTTDNGKINIETEETGSEVGETGNEIETGKVNTEVGDPGEYSYSECNETVYVNNPGSAVTLRTAAYEPKGSVAHGTELKRIGLSTDEANYWSKVLYQENEYYVATKFLTTMQNPDEGFVEVSKTVQINEQTGSLKIRNIPTMESSTVIGYANTGKDVKVIAENTETGWYKIEFVNADGETVQGYIASDAKYFVSNKAETETGTEAGTEATTEANTESKGK
jgi:uncharacterized protein YgiM (DUF1202 family)